MLLILMPLRSESLIHLTSLSSTSTWSPVTPFKHLAEPATGLETIFSTKWSFCLNRVKMHVLEIPYFFRISSALKPGLKESPFFTSLHLSINKEKTLSNEPASLILTLYASKLFCFHSSVCSLFLSYFVFIHLFVLCFKAYFLILIDPTRKVCT